MVQLEEVPDDELNQNQQGPDDEDWDTDSESNISVAESEIDLEESLTDRLYALKDIVPPVYRTHLSNASSAGYSYASTGLSFAGKAMWIISTSALLLGIPFAMAFNEEQQFLEMEREMKMQQGANELLTQGQSQGQGQQGAQAAQ